MINVTPAINVGRLRDENGEPLDGTEVVARYLQPLPDRTAAPQLHRIRLLAPLPAARFGFPEVPLRGAAP